MGLGVHTLQDVSAALVYDPLKSVPGLPVPLSKEKTMILSHLNKTKWNQPWMPHDKKIPLSATHHWGKCWRERVYEEWSIPFDTEGLPSLNQTF